MVKKVISDDTVFEDERSSVSEPDKRGFTYNEESDEDEDFEKQSSSSSDDDSEEGVDESKLQSVESSAREWRKPLISYIAGGNGIEVSKYLHTDDVSSDEEENIENNTIGRVPLHWYDAYDHIGYKIDGSKVIKKNGPDRVDITIRNAEKHGIKSIFDMYNNKEVILSERDLELIRRIQMGAIAHPEHDDTPDYSDYYSSVKEVMPLSAAPEPKRRFVPSKWETMRVMKILKSIKEGKYKVGDSGIEKNSKDLVNAYMIWKEDEDEILSESKRYKFHLPAPKMPLPGHAESYNPPQEYLLTEEEKQRYDEMDPEERPHNFIPKSHTCLRHVGGYGNFLKERFERCLDLYLCPRKLKHRLNIDPETLIPRLPRPRELKPFPNTLCLQFLGHAGAVRSLSLSPDGQYFASGGDDGTVRLWEVDTCLCRYIWQLGGGPVAAVTWNPSPDAYQHHLLAAAVGKWVVLIATGTAEEDGSEVTESQLAAAEALALGGDEAGVGGLDEGKEEGLEGEEDDDKVDGRASKAKKGSKMVWKICSDETQERKHGVLVGPRVRLEFAESVLSVVWHYKGDYLATLTSSSGSDSVSIHQISKAKSQMPFTKSPGKVQAVSFHPSRPFLFVVTQQHVKVFHLVEQTLVKKLMSGCKWLSSLDVHPSGDHVIVGSYDRRVVWFDLDLSSAPYKTLKFHEKAVRNIQFHKRYPLMASGSDDGNVHVFHSMVYSDLTRNPLIVPLKVLKGHDVVGGLGIFSIAFHPRQPWIFTAGADGVINLFQDI